MTNFSDSAYEIVKKRYFDDSETRWGELAERVAIAISTKEQDKKWVDIFATEINDMLFIPGGRILRNAGKLKQSMLNCGTIPISDSIEAIGEAIKSALILWKYGAGVGINFSSIRYKGAPLISGGGESSGLVSFLHAFDAVAHTIETGGQRRSGCLGLLSIRHPEIFDFINAKVKDKTLSYFNLSVGIDKSFLTAVEEDTAWDLKFAGQTVKTVRAVDLWERILEGMVRTGEPGLINTDNLRKNNSFYFQPTTITNLCQPEWATVLTKDGIREIKDINVGDTIWSEDGWVHVVNKQASGTKKVFRWRTNAGVFYGTKDHKVVSNGEKIRAVDAESIDILRGTCNNDKLIDNIIMDGIVIGDGSVHKASNNLVHLYIGQNDSDYFTSEINHLIKKHRPGLKECAYEIDTSIISQELPYTYDRFIPDRFKYGNSTVVRSFLRGLFTANGAVLEKYGRVTLAAASERIVEDVQVMLSSIGIKSYITKNKGYTTKFKNGVYTSRKSYDINITTDVHIFAEKVGFIQKYKTDKLVKMVNRKKKAKKPDKITFDIYDIELISTEPVFNLTVSGKHHTYWTGGCNVANCGEIPLPENFGMCCLGSLVLPKFITGQKNTNWKKLEGSIHNAVRFLDNVLDVNFFPIKQAEMTSLDARRIGLGVMGLHDYLLAKEIRYGSERSYNEIERLFKFIRDTAYSASIDLAKEKGTFPMYKRSEYCSSSFVKKLPAKLRLNIKEHGIRNCCILSCPPTGTSSLIAEVSSGIEPIFSLAHLRKDRVSDRYYIHPKLVDCIKNDKEKPEWLIDSSDLSPEEHLEIQTIIQRYCDNAVSKTINCPNGFTVSDLSNILREAIVDLKGITVYVEGSREGEVLNRMSYEDAKKHVEKSTTTILEDEVKCSKGTCEI